MRNALINDLPLCEELDSGAMAAVQGARKPLKTYDLTGGTISANPLSPNGPTTPDGALGIIEGFVLPNGAAD
jgi:hypothetical protein